MQPTAVRDQARLDEREEKRVDSAPVRLCVRPRVREVHAHVGEGLAREKIADEPERIHANHPYVIDPLVS